MATTHACFSANKWLAAVCSAALAATTPAPGSPVQQADPPLTACSPPPGSTVTDVSRLNGVDPHGRTNSQQALAQLLRGGKRTLYFPAGRYVVDGLVIESGTTVLTDGARTVFNQSDAGWFDRPIIKIVGSHVCMDGAGYVGNPSRDLRVHSLPNEFNHAVAIVPTEDVDDVSIVAIRAREILGDALYVGGRRTAEVRNVKVGSVWGTNVFRSGVSVVGGDNIQIGAIDGESFGYRALNIEPNPGSSQTPDHIGISYLRASQMQVAGDPEQPVGMVRVERADFSSRYQANSQPGYSNGSIGFAGSGMAALIATNVKQLDFGSVSAAAYDEVPFIFGESRYKSSVRIGQISIAASGRNARRRGLFHEVGAGGLASLEIGVFKLAPDSSSRQLFTGNPSVFRAKEISRASLP